MESRGGDECDKEVSPLRKTHPQLMNLQRMTFFPVEGYFQGSDSCNIELKVEENGDKLLFHLIFLSFGGCLEAECMPARSSTV